MNKKIVYEKDKRIDSLDELIKEEIVYDVVCVPHIRDISKYYRKSLRKVINEVKLGHLYTVKVADSVIKTTTISTSDAGVVLTPATYDIADNSIWE